MKNRCPREVPATVRSRGKARRAVRWSSVRVLVTSSASAAPRGIGANLALGANRYRGDRPDVPEQLTLERKKTRSGSVAYPLGVTAAFGEDEACGT